MSRSSWPPLAVVVPNYNGAAHLEACFASLEALDYPRERLELLLVDNGSTDDSLALMRQRFPRVRVLRNQTNLGFAAACNQGVAAARAPYVALLNNDARVDRLWAQALVAPMLEQPTIAAVGAKILDWTGERIDFAGGLLNFYGHAFQRLYGAPASADTATAERPTLFACGGAMAVRRDAFLAAGGFDEAYFAFFEDVDLGWRLWLLGYAVVLAPRAIAYHRGHATAARLPRHQLRVLYERNALYTILKNYEAATLARVLPAALLLAVQRGLMSARLETAPYVLGREAGDTEERVPRLGLSHFVALGELGLKLDEVWAKREAIQRQRRRPDAEILALFGEPFMPNHVDPRYLATQERLVRVFGIDRLFAASVPPAIEAPGEGGPCPTPGAGAGPTVAPAPAAPATSEHPADPGPVLLVAGDPVAARMAGPGVRCWELARALARAGLPVLLAVPNADPLPGEGFEVVSYHHQPERLVALARAARAVVVQGFLLQKVPALRTLGRPLVVDLYDPFILENLQFFAGDRLPFREAIHAEHLAVLNDQLQAGDFFLCASERQRDYWLGMLAANNRLNPRTYDADPTLRALIDVVPYGLPAEPPRAHGPALKGVLPGIGPDDRVLLWGGGLWDWFDPLTLLRALARVVAVRPEVRLVFLGTRHPNAALPPMAMPRRAQALAAALGLADRTLFLDWVPYPERAAYLLEADVGVSLHLEGVETRFAFRSRLLDYLWAGLPLVCTRGDTLADLVEREGLGRVVPPGDVAAVAQALRDLLAQPDLRARLAPRFAAVAATLTWDRAAAPLVAYCRAPRRAPDQVAPAGEEAAPRAERRPRLPFMPAPDGRRRGPPPGAVAVVSYVVRPTPWWRLPLRAWYFLRLGGPRRLGQEVSNYWRWLRMQRRTPSAAMRPAAASEELVEEKVVVDPRAE